MMINTERSIEEIKKLRQYLPESTNEELENILEYWEEIKKRWEEKKQEFWKGHSREDFKNLLQYKWEHKGEYEWRYEYLSKMDLLEKEKFVEEYLYDDMLYSGNFDDKKFKWEIKEYSYEDFKCWNFVVKKWVSLNFWWNKVGVELAKKIVDLELCEWMTINLHHTDIWIESLGIIAKNLRLKKWISLILYYSKLWDEWAKIIAENMKLQEWVDLNLRENRIWAEWAKVIAENMELKEWVVLNLGNNQIWAEWAEAIAKDM